MSKAALILVGTLIPFLGTTLGAAMVFVIRGGLRPRLQKALLGFASGVMIAASVWSLLIPAMDLAAEAGTPVYLPAAVGFLAGIGFLLLLDTLIPHLHAKAERPEGRPVALRKTTMLLIAITLHNLPEGMAVGVVLSGAVGGARSISAAAAVALAAGIAVQNFPEGAVVSLPLLSEGASRPRAFLYGVMTGVVEPVGALLTVLLASALTPILPYILAFAAGAMIYVVVDELIPEAQAGEHSNVGTIGAALGFALMMVLDIALG